MKTDQSNVTDYVASDFMTSYDFVKKGTAGPASLTMKRMFSKINLEFTSTNISAEDLVNSFAEMTLNTTAVADLQLKLCRLLRIVEISFRKADWRTRMAYVQD